MAIARIRRNSKTFRATLAPKPTAYLHSRWMWVQSYSDPRGTSGLLLASAPHQLAPRLLLGERHKSLTVQPVVAIAVSLFITWYQRVCGGRCTYIVHHCLLEFSVWKPLLNNWSMQLVPVKRESWFSHIVQCCILKCLIQRMWCPDNWHAVGYLYSSWAKTEDRG